MAVKHKLLRGLGAGKYLGFATQKLGRLATEARGPGPSRTKRYTVDNGMVDIKVSIQDEQHYVKIKRKTCPSFLSGLCDLVLQPLGGGVFSPVYQVPDPEDATQTIDVFRRFYPAQAVRAWRDEPRLATSAAAAEQLVHLKASMFSGEMRKYVQVLQGQGKEAYYSPSFAVTHGIFKSSTGSRWLISIGGNGVFAWPLSVCRATPVVDAQGNVLLDYTPVQSYHSLAAEVSAATAAGSVILLLAPSEMAVFYQYAPMFPACGWAFSETGARALNVGWTADGDYIATALFEVTISEVDGLPRSAALARREYSRIYGTSDKGDAQIKYPVGSELYSFSIRSATAAAPISFKAPIYAYFDGGTRHVVYLELATPAVSTEPHSDIVPLSGINSCVSDEDFGPVFTDATITRTNPMWFSFPNGDNKVSLTANNVATFTDLRGPTYHGQGYSIAEVIGDRYYVVIHDVTKGTDWRYRQAFIVPLFDRQAFYIASERVNTEAVAVERLTRQLLGGKDVHVAVHVQDCASIPGARAIVQAGAITPGVPCVRNNVTGDGQYTKNFIGGLPYLVQPGQPFATRNVTTCADIPGILEPFDNVLLGPYDRETRMFRFEFYGSGGAMRVLPEYPAAITGTVVGDLFRFIEIGERQIMAAVRDAFDGGTYIITKEVNKLSGPDLASSAHGYPVAQVGTSWAFIGVP